MHAAPRSLERISLIVPEHALEPWEAALRATCDSVSFFRDHTAETWHLEGIRSAEAPNAPLTAAVALAETLTGLSPAILVNPLTPTAGSSAAMPNFLSSASAAASRFAAAISPPRLRPAASHCCWMPAWPSAQASMARLADA